ncbi:MAG: hypothetical protein JWN25_1282 [Verrucomicrobiales bacterium]|nr:hypothetical protein [Verrucomicrobiales bacterium]
MRAKFKYPTASEIPNEIKAFYVEQNGAWILDAEGAVDKSRLDEFRNNNLALSQEVQTLKARFEGIDPANYKALAERDAARAEQELLQKGEFQTVLEQKTQALKGELNSRIKQAEVERDQLRNRLEEIQIDQAVTAAATQRGLRPSAMTDLLNRARASMELREGKVNIRTSDGQGIQINGDGTPMTLEQWTDQLQQAAPHLFEPNFGSGAPNHSSGGAVRNPFASGKDWNLTEQMKLVKSNPQMAARLGTGRH